MILFIMEYGNILLLVTFSMLVCFSFAYLCSSVVSFTACKTIVLLIVTANTFCLICAGNVINRTWPLYGAVQAQNYVKQNGPSHPELDTFSPLKPVLLKCRKLTINKFKSSQIFVYCTTLKPHIWIIWKI